MRASAALLGLLAAALTCSQTPAVQADTPAENKAAARALAVQGVQLAQEDSCEEALPLLERAEALYHAPTILFHIGECQIRLGRLVEGSETLNQVVREPLPNNAPAAFLDAQKQAQALIEQTLPRIAHLTIQVTPLKADLTMSVNGSPISNAFVGVARPSDPGTHRIEVSAPRYRTAHAKVVLEEGGTETVVLTLEPAEDAVSAQPEESAVSGPSTQRIVSYVSLGLGGALLATGGVTGLMAMGKKNTLKQECPGGQCPAEQERTLDSARTLAGFSTAFSVAGAAAGLGGLVLLLTDSESSEQPVQAQPKLQPYVGLGSVGFSGTF